MTELILTEDDLGRVHEKLASFGWFHFAIEDRNRRAWLIHEDERGEMHATTGATEEEWLPAAVLLRLHGPLTVLQDLSKPFGRKAAPLGEPTDKSVIEILGVSEEAFEELTKRHTMHKVMRYIEQGCRFCVGPIGGEA